MKWLVSCSKRRRLHEPAMASNMSPGFNSLPAAAASIEVAFCFPYGQDELDRLVAASGLRLQAVGACERGRPLLRLDNGPGERGSSRPGLFILACQHSGETPGSWVLDGLLKRLASLGAAAPLTWAMILTACMTAAMARTAIPSTSTGPGQARTAGRGRQRR